MFLKSKMYRKTKLLVFLFIKLVHPFPQAGLSRAEPTGFRAIAEAEHGWSHHSLQTAPVSPSAQTHVISGPLSPLCRLLAVQGRLVFWRETKTKMVNL